MGSHGGQRIDDKHFVSEIDDTDYGSPVHGSASEPTLRKLDPTPQCSTCNVTFSVEHILFHCALYREERGSWVAYCRGRGLPLTQTSLLAEAATQGEPRVKVHQGNLVLPQGQFNQSLSSTGRCKELYSAVNKMSPSPVIVAFLTLLVQAHGQIPYETHPSYYPQPVHPVTETVTVTETQTIRVPVTSDIWVSTATPYTVRVTSLATDYTFVPANAETVTAVVAVTNTPISVVRETSCINPVRTAVSVYTTFLTETERKDLYHTVTHVDVHHEINTVAVPSVQTLVQRATTTTIQFTTVTVTSTTFGYYH
ncbi:uncharacterized protein LOC123518758 [Portunus trituberculatus]|uniref:uncharacterized protein LOC123518758 n=1 Tax=Portunus trituberculatus TaxID=210409 RepID=UPI001E1CBB60|nr:uncharacterized protein LOC123518758 [Portunus trituberculatus]